MLASDKLTMLILVSKQLLAFWVIAYQPKSEVAGFKSVLYGLGNGVPLLNKSRDLRYHLILLHKRCKSLFKP